MSSIRRRLMSQVASDPNALPVGCVRCEYLEGTGTQWIDTGYFPNIGDELFLQNVKVCGNYSAVVFSAGNADYQLILLYAAAKSAYFKYFISGSAKSIGFDNRTTHNVKIGNGGELYINGEHKTTSSPIHGVNTSLHIFIRADKNQKFTGTIGEVVITNYGEWRVHLIPCLDSNGTPCFYDTVAKKFHYNQGTGDFLYKIADQ